MKMYHFILLGVLLVVPCLGRSQTFAQTADQPVTSSVAQTPNASATDDPLQELPALVRQAVAKVRPSIVTIESFGGVTTKQGEIGGIRKQGEGNTTGILIGEDGLVVTSRFNFATSPRVISVVTSDGQRHSATVLAQDMTRNLCVLQMDDFKGGAVPTWVPADRRNVGRYAISVGVGYGDAHPAVSVGIVSAHNRIFGRAMQTDANISPANYGGPLVDLTGQVYGICVPLSPKGNSAVAGTEWYDSGIGFVIPITGKDSWLDNLKQGHSIYPGSMGVTVTGNDQGPGLKVHQVVDKFPAQVAGLQKDDVILQANGTKLERQADLFQIIRRCTAGQVIEIVFTRGENPEPEELKIELAVHPDALPKSLIPGLPPLHELQ